MNSFNCYIHFPLSRQWMDCIGAGFGYSCVILPLPLRKVRQGYIALTWGILYFLLFFNVLQQRQNARYIQTNSCTSMLNSSR